MVKEKKSEIMTDGKRFAKMFSSLSEENKSMAIVYLSALRDKEMADMSSKSGEDTSGTA